jgi:hypothetical protein
MAEKKATPEFPGPDVAGQPGEIEKTLASLAADLQDLSVRADALEKAVAKLIAFEPPAQPGTPKGAKERLERLESAFIALLSATESGSGPATITAIRREFTGA